MMANWHEILHSIDMNGALAFLVTLASEQSDPLGDSRQPLQPQNKN
jgi:hypothetical protein